MRLQIELQSVVDYSTNSAEILVRIDPYGDLKRSYQKVIQANCKTSAEADIVGQNYIKLLLQNVADLIQDKTQELKTATE